jgi:hypothetical protein
MYILKDLDNNTYFCGGNVGDWIGWSANKKQAKRYDAGLANEGISFWKSKGKNVIKERVKK